MLDRNGNYIEDYNQKVEFVKEEICGTYHYSYFSDDKNNEQTFEELKNMTQEYNTAEIKNKTSEIWDMKKLVNIEIHSNNKYVIADFFEEKTKFIKSFNADKVYVVYAINFNEFLQSFCATVSFAIDVDNELYMKKVKIIVLKNDNIEVIQTEKFGDKNIIFDVNEVNHLEKHFNEYSIKKKVKNKINNEYFITNYRSQDIQSIQSYFYDEIKKCEKVVRNNYFIVAVYLDFNIKFDEIECCIVGTVTKQLIKSY